MMKVLQASMEILGSPEYSLNWVGDESLDRLFLELQELIIPFRSRSVNDFYQSRDWMIIDYIPKEGADPR